MNLPLAALPCLAGLLALPAAAAEAANAAFASGHRPAVTLELKTRLARADAAAGAAFFERKCSQCHDGE